MKILGTIVLSIGVLVGALLFLLLSTCALNRQATSSFRAEYAGFALLDALAMVGVIWAIGSLNRK